VIAFRHRDSGEAASSWARSQKRETASGSEGRNRVLDLALQAQQLTARDEQRQVGAAGDKSRELGRGFDHLLQVVEQQEHLPLADLLS
jgi:hypothetical protein